jgi:hypothetical protein
MRRIPPLRFFLLALGVSLLGIVLIFSFQRTSLRKVFAVTTDLVISKTAQTFTTANLIIKNLTYGGKTISATADDLNKLVGVSPTGTLQGQINTLNSTITNTPKLPKANPAITGTATFSNVVGITKSMVGLGNVDDTSDANKPVSTAQATALALKANSNSPTFTGTVLLPTGKSTGSNLAIGTLNITPSAAKFDVVSGNGIATGNVTAATFNGNLSGSADTATTAINFTTTILDLRGSGSYLGYYGSIYTAPGTGAINILQNGYSWSTPTQASNEFNRPGPGYAYFDPLRFTRYQAYTTNDFVNWTSTTDWYYDTSGIGTTWVKSLYCWGTAGACRSDCYIGANCYYTSGASCGTIAACFPFERLAGPMDRLAWRPVTEKGTGLNVNLGAVITYPAARVTPGVNSSDQWYPNSTSAASSPCYPLPTRVQNCLIGSGSNCYTTISACVWNP